MFLQVLLFLPVMSTWGIPTWYQDARQSFIDEEKAMRVGANLVLNANEQLVNNFLMKLKNETIQQSIWTTTPYPPSVSFFKSKPWIDNSTIFQVIKRMPKGGVLHLHDSAMTSLDWIVKHLTYAPNLYTRVTNDTYPRRRYQKNDTHPGNDWRLVSELRSSFSDPNDFDKQLVKEMSIWVEDPFVAYPSINDVWKKFNTYFTSVNDLLNNLTLWRSYIEEAFREFYNDGVQYMEIKTGTMFDSHGNDITGDYMEVIQNVTSSLKQRHPDFIGVKVIIAGRRSLPRQEPMVNRTLALMKRFPGLVIGFDLLQQEDNTHVTVDYIDDLMKNGHSVLPYFFHAGETDWTQWVDLNLVDSVLLNASRIGHGFAAYHHPKVLEAVMKKGIAIELNPVSNQVLGLVADLRNHPGAFLIANGAPVVISSDDPPVWFANPLSHDFYMAFMALGSVHDDLRLLKQLAMNSITFSSMSSAEKVDAYTKWQNRWDTFIHDIIVKYKLSTDNSVIG
ncbi:adenosine deaminase AGSA-like [Biomphalaria glabrata]|uniref:adenosine deaminase n=1 Tax=Biomphalaria glabrata TaxID=6526 RepID=A0A9W3AXQ3_BIOGL|nr:adenosine deaminase AGSA-like [Biomphalaria glabrata]XP_055891997.1 adenosine deaminase AGSA-like [Biomphalaria glabrata]